MKQRPLDRSMFEGEWRGDEDNPQLLQYFLSLASDTAVVSQESAGNYVVNVMDSTGDVPFTVQRVSKETGRKTSLTAAPVIENTDAAAATTKSANAKGFTLVPRTAGRLVLSLIDKLGTARGKLIVNVHATPPVIENPGTVTPTDPGTMQPGTTNPVTPADPGGNPGTGDGTTVPTEPTSPTEPTTPVDPGTGGGTTEPTSPTEPTTPVYPGTGGETTEPTEPTSPGTGGGTTTPANPGTTEPTTPVDPGTGGGTTTPTNPTQPTDPGTGGGTTDPTTPTQPTTPVTPAPPPKKPVLGFKVSVGVAPTKVGDNFELKVRLAVGALTVTVTDDIGIADGDLKFEYVSTGITVAVWSVVPSRSMKLLILGIGTATLTVTHVPTGVKTSLKINITLL